jgi:methyl-accepting chemotaxis protein
MGLRKKISLGFVVIGAILFLSSIIAIFEFNRIRHSVTDLMKDNINSINTSRMLLELTDEYNFMLLSSVIMDSTLNSTEVVYDDRFEKYIGSIKSQFASEAEIATADSLSVAYKRYLAEISLASNIMTLSVSERKEWYNNKLMPVYKNLRNYKRQLGLLTQGALAKNTAGLQEGFYRSIMPGIIAVAAGIILVLLFNYFINLYFISPILLISRGLKSYKEFNKSYTVQFDNDDELQDLNEEVRSLIEEHKTLKKHRE